MKRTRKQRLFSILLVISMIMQQTFVLPVIAEDHVESETAAAVVQTAEAPETKAAKAETTPETKAPETQAPETKAPETKAPETQAPETQAPKPEVQEAKAPETQAAETKAPETQAPETKAPETQAPETQAPETQAPETQAPETQAPETQAPETQAPETQAPETQAPETQAPETQAPATEAPATEAPATEAPATEAPVTEAPATEAPVTEAPETVAPATEAPATEAPETEAPVTEAPETEAPDAHPETEAPETETAAPETETEIKETETEVPETETETEIETETETEAESETETETETEAPKTHFTYEDSRVRITADASEEANLPQDAVLKADYLAPGSSAYNAAVAKVKAAYGLGDDVELECAPYDIYFVSKGSRIEPEDGTVKVTIQFVKPVLGEAEGDLIDKGIAHIKDNGSVEDLNGSVNTNAQGEVSSVGFTTDSFSIFAPFTVSQVAPRTTTSSNLNQFVTNVVFDNNLYDADGALVLHPNSEYSFKMEFAESIYKGLFEKEGELTYTFPAQLAPAGAGGTFDMNITDGEEQYKLSGNTYTIEGNTIKVRFNKDGGAAYEALKAASNAEFWLSLRAKVDANASGDKIKFGDSVEKTVKFDNTAAVSVEKSGSYDKTSGKMNYTVKVKSTGTSTNVKVTDVITGTLLTYDKNVTATSNQKGALTIDSNATAKGNGFEYTIPSMSDGEEVTFSYSASVDYSKLSGDQFTVDETKNTVTAKGDNTDEVSKDHNFDHTTAYDTGITKSGTKGEITNGWQTSNWTITVNADAKTDVGGSLVTDKIQENKKVPTKYSGAGITVKKYKADGTLVSSEPIPWDQLKSHSDTTWSYELPQKDGTPYKYEISYTTTSDISKTTENTSVTNHAEFDGRGTDGNVGVEGQNQFGVTKTHAAPSKDGVNWTVNVTIPNCGFNESFTITDALPFTWTGGYHADSYKERSLQIAMNGQTIAADNYDIKYTAPVTEGHNKSSGSIQVVFKPEKLAGLFPATTGTERVLTMTYTTIPDSTWPDGENHTNTVTATGDGTSKYASDSYILKEHEISKSVENGNATIGGMPAYKFKIYLRGVDTDTLEIHDIFDPDLFEIVTTDSNSYNNAQFGAGDQYWDADNGANGSSNGGVITVTPTKTGATFSIKNVATKSGGAYYSWYSIRYYLKVKDAEALKKIQQAAAKNPDHTTKIGNTAEWEGKSTDEVSAEYKVNPLTKTETGSPNKLNHYTSTFTVVVNPDKLQLNGGNDLTVTDTFSDAMELVTDSVKITLEPAGASSWDFGADKKSLTITIPDGCKAVITYDAQITGKGHVTYKNNVTVTGNYSASTGDKSVDISTDGEGSAEHFQYKVIKRDSDDRQKRLQGAIFQLFERKDGSETAVKNNKTGGDVTFTTDANGEFMMAGAYQADGWELTKGHTYVLKEIQAPEGYKKADPLTFTVGSITADGAHGNGYTFDIYDEEGKDIDISVVKEWNDANNQDGKRPGRIMVQLYADGEPHGAPVELNENNNWSYTWSKLPDRVNDKLIDYTVRELQKTEDGSMAAADDGADITYLVNDADVTYKVGYSHKDNDWTISNTYTPETIKISGSKTWNDADNQDGIRPDKIVIKLLADGKVTATKEVTEADDWKWSFTDLPKYKDAGTEIVYTIEEEKVTGYESSVNGYDVTNKHTPETIKISGSKTWNDADNQDGIRPDKIVIKLLADGKVTATKEVTEADDWKWSFTDLPKYKDAGTEIVYTIEEKKVTGYESSVNGYDVTNKHTPETIRISGSKTWNDADNQDGKRPDSITINVLANGVKVASKTVTKADGWSWTFTDMPKYANGAEITYTITEEHVQDYTTVVDGYNVENSYAPGKVDIPVTKSWNDENNTDGHRPSSITVKLLADGVDTGERLILDASNRWSGSFSNLDEKKNGQTINYTVEEESVTLYTGAVTGNMEDGFVITNTHKPETTEATVKKVWNDGNNQDGKRLAAITVKLYGKAGEAAEELVLETTLSEANNWTFTKNDLPKFKNGAAYTYYWTEATELPGYTVEVDQKNGEKSFVTTLTNTHTPEKTQATVKKVWDDAKDNDGKRPETITVVLKKKNGQTETTVKSYELNDANGWTVTVTDLDAYTNGVANEYSWTEDETGLPDGYSLESTDVQGTITTLTNKYAPGKVSVTVKKEWNDADNQDGIRPVSLEVVLKKNGEPYRTVTLDSNNQWSFTVKDLDEYTGGQKNSYTWDETSVPDGYTLSSSTEGSITTLTNTHTPETVNATVVKVWDDADNQDSKRPQKLTVTLMKNETVVVEIVTLDEANGWTAKVENLAKNENNGTPIRYSWVEGTMEEGYSLSNTVITDEKNGNDVVIGKITTLTNSYTPGKVSASVKKVWDDAGNQDGIRPETLKVNLLKNGEPTGQFVTLSEENNWTAAITDLDEYTNKVLNEYTWSEEGLPDGYGLVSDEKGADGVATLTNRHTPELVSASVKKIWDDADNQDGIRPLELTVTLWRRAKQAEEPDVDIQSADTAAVEVKTVTLNQANNWSAEETGLAKYTDGVENEYFWTEEAIDGYELTDDSTDSGDNAYFTTLTNTHTPEKVNVRIHKVWDDADNQDGKRPTELTVDLMRNGTELVKTVTLNADNNWADEVRNLDKYTGGALNEYSWVEKDLKEGYSLTNTETQTEEATKETAETVITTLTNSYTPGKVEASVRKVWEDADNIDQIRPDSITVILMKNGEPTNQKVTLNANNDWKATITGLDEYTDGTKNEYSWKEETVPDGYTLTNTETEGRLTTLTNTHTPSVINMTIRKVWNDAENQDGVRPTEIKVDLKRDGKVIHTVTLNEANGWETEVRELPRNGKNGEYTYSWSEQTDGLPEGYKLTGDVTEGEITTLTNTRVPDTVSVGVRKIWDDADNQDGIRPSELKVNLLKNGEATGQYVILNEENGWTATITNLPKNTAVGILNTYTWSEEELPAGYTVTVSDPDVNGITTLTNVHTPATIDASVEKTWDDNKDQDGKRPETLLVTLMRRIREQAKPLSADDTDANPAEEVTTVELTAANGWKAAVSGLPKYKNGQEYEYFWTEKDENVPEGYKLTNEVTGNTVTEGKGVTAIITSLTNSHKPQKINAIVKKVWDDNDNQDGKRAPELMVELLRNGTEVAGTVTLNEENGWTGTVEDLDKYTGGVENVYTWVEKDLPEGYSLTETEKEVTEATEDTLEAAITTLTNKHTPGKVSASILKIWDDAENQDGIRPETITAILLKNGEETDQSVMLSADNDWSAIITDLDEYTDGTLNKYTWKEAEVPEGYELTLNETDGTFTTLTNTHKPETVSVGVRKIWDDNENQDGIRPETLKVNLLKNGEPTDQYVILDADNDWTATITDLPKNTAVGKLNTYTWSEEGLPEGYTVTVSEPDENGITTLTNTHTPATIEATVEKTWDDNEDQDGKRPEKLLVTLMRRIREQAVAMSLEDADDADTNPAEEVMTVELTAANGWKASVSNQPKYKDGQMYEYFWIEKKDNIPDGYKLTNEVTYDIFSSEKGVTGFITTLTNSHKPQKINAVVKKVWDDNENQDGKRPTELTVDLMRNGTEVAGTVTLNEENDWTGTVENLDKYTGGEENVYTWVEKNLPEGYSLTETEKEVTEATEDTLEAAITTLTNKHTPGKVSANILKIWDDAENQDGIRPETITAILLKNGEETDQSVTLSAENDWSAIITDLDEYTDGTLNEYTWKEAEVPEGYELTQNKTDGAFTTLNNKHVPELVNVSVRKEWNDADNQDGIRPTELKVDLKKNGTVIGTVTLNEENGWSDEVKDLPKYTDGVENDYTWAEQEDGLPEGYELTDTKIEKLLAPEESTVSIITTLTNSHTPETVDVEGSKTWYDGGDESARPESIKIRIYADGEELTDLAQTVDPALDWKWSFTDLPKYKEGEVGQEITYTITEDPVDGYISEVDGYNVTNTRSAAVSKVDIGTGEELTGAHFQVLDGAGTIVDEWDSKSGTNHVINGIKTGVEYTLHESKAPEGYETAADVTFTVAKDGTVSATASVVNGVILVEDKLTASENTSVTIEKTVTYNGLSMFVENLSFNVRLFYDEACTKPATELKKVTIVSGISSKVTFNNLEAGRTYYVGECDADGTVINSGELEDGTVYKPVFSGTDGRKITTTEGEDEVVYLDNQLDRWPHQYYAVGELTVTKKLVGRDGTPKNSDGVFYAGIFDDPEYTTLTDRAEYNILELDLFGGSEASVSTAVQIESIDSVTTLYVTEVDEEGNPVIGAAGFEYEVSVDQTEVSLSAASDSAVVTITNKEEEQETETETEVYEGKLTVTKKLLGYDGLPKKSHEIFYAGIFEDEAYTKLSDKVESNILALALKGNSETSAQTSVTIESKDAKTVLYVTEVDKNGTPVEGKAGFRYSVKVDGSKAEVTAGKEASVVITNASLNRGYYEYGELIVTKKLLGADGKPKNSDEVFYAGIFDDPEYTTLSDHAEYNILELALNGNSEVSQTVQVGIDTVDSTTTLYVTEVDENGNPVKGAAGFAYEVGVDSTKVEMTAERLESAVVITNKEITETETETETKKQTESETQKTTKPTGDVKTGDDTPIGSYAGLMAVAFAAFALLLVSEQKRRKTGRR